MYCMLMMGLALLAFAVKAWMQVNQLERNGQRVTAKVIGLPRGRIHRDEPGETEITYELVVRYRPPDEKPLELRVATGRGRGFKLHQEIQIIYDPAKPEERAILPGEDLTVGPLILTIVGFILTIFGLASVLG